MMAPDLVGGHLTRAMMSLVGMGSVSSYVLEHSRVPTVIVRNGTALDTVLKPKLVRPDVCSPAAVSRLGRCSPPCSAL